MTIYYFTATYPYGICEQWKTNEIHEFAKRGYKVIVVPLVQERNEPGYTDFSNNVEVLQPLFAKNFGPIDKIEMVKILLSKYAYKMWKEFFAGRVPLSKNRLISWANSNRYVYKLLNHETIKGILSKNLTDSVLYFYWGRGSSDILPFIKKTPKLSMVRLHGFDLYEHRNFGYIPYRKELIRKVDQLLLVSENGRKYLEHKYPESTSKTHVMRLGTINRTGARSSLSTDNILRVVSCSSLVALKRVHLMIEAVALVDFPIKWTHIGGGDLMNELKELIVQLNLQDKFEMMGAVNSDKVLAVYQQGHFDAFVNASTTEGVPVSVMEAFSVGIPVIATNVGGTSEIVDNEVGKLIPADLSARDLANTLAEYYQLPANKKMKLADNAYARYEERCSAQKLSVDLADFISEQTNG